MKHTKRVLAIVAACLLMAGVALAQDTYTVSKEEYELLQKYQRLEEIMAVIDQTFLFEYDKDALLQGAAQGMIGSLGDEYTFYYTPNQMETENEAVTGEYGGLGIEVFANPNDLTITIKRVFYGSPAQEGGLRVSDKIIKVNGEDMTAYDLNKAVSIMRGEVGGEVTLMILREMETFEVTLTRAIVQTEIMSYEMLEDRIGYLRIHYFEGNAVGQFEEAAQRFVDEDIKGLVIDLRDNPGGLVNLAIDIADKFLDDMLVTTTEDKYGRRLSYYTHEGAWEIPVVVLVNDYSASAAEILAAALQENGAARLVGVQTFGKGIMQSVYTFAGDGAGMQITSDYWLTPKGNNIHEVGIAPDVEVELNEDAVDDNFQFIRAKDNQLQKAVEVLKEEIAQRGE